MTSVKAKLRCRSLRRSCPFQKKNGPAQALTSQSLIRVTVYEVYEEENVMRSERETDHSLQNWRQTSQQVVFESFQFHEKMKMENGHTVTDMLDPTMDLHWSDYQGAIQDRFADNARKFPDRLCVVETPSRTTPQREFTYQQIHEASNVVAHYFLQRGIERGEVIMIYAYRGVDLCVAILAVLKAGATFSVVDPAYDSFTIGTKENL